MTEQALQQLIELIKNASPVVWQAIMKQVTANSFELLFWSLVSFCAMFIFLKLAAYGNKMKQEEKDDWETPYLSGIFLAALCFTVASMFLIEVLERFYNPEFYAIRYILEQLK